MYGDTAVLLDVEDVVNTVFDLFSIESADQLMGFTNANDFSEASVKSFSHQVLTTVVLSLQLISLEFFCEEQWSVCYH